MSFLRAVLVAGAVLVLSAGGPASAAIQPEVSEQDRRFLAEAHQSNLAEIEMGTLAQEKGQADVVRSIGALLVTDHTRLDTTLRATARELGVSLPDRPMPRHQAEHARLAALSGAAFDRAWVEAMIQGHRMALAAGERELQAGSAPQAKRIAESSAPVIQGHLDRLLQARQVVGAPLGVPAGTGGQAAIPVDRPFAPGYGLLVAGLLVTVGGALLWRRPARWKR